MTGGLQEEGIMPFKIVRNDITRMQVDAIVNTANEAPIYSDGTDTAVYKAAGEEALLAERRKIGFLEEGEVAITSGFQLPARYIIHAVSPFFRDGASGEEEKLRSCYRKSLQLAYEHQCKSIAFPLIATGSYGYPREEGMRIALDEINAFLLKCEMLIYLVVFDAQSTRLGSNLYPDMEAYIDHNYVCDKWGEEYSRRNCSSFLKSSPEISAYIPAVDRQEQKVKPSPVEKLRGMFSSKSVSQHRVSCSEEAEGSYEDFLEETNAALNERMKHLSDTFQEYLLFLIDSKGLTNAEVYKRAIITKQLFSKIKVNADYHPDKSTAMRLCVGAKLNLDEAKDLLARAGYALSPCDKRDIIFSYFIEKEVFDMIEIDIALEQHDLPCFIE